MQESNIILDILNNRSILNHEINNIYHYLYNTNLYILAHKNLSNLDVIPPNKLHRIDNMISEIKLQKYRWNKELNKFNNFDYHSNINEWQDRLLQEVIRLILYSVYKSKFIKNSYDISYKALSIVAQKGRGCEFFIQNVGNINFNIINKDKMLSILKKDIKDNRFIELIRKYLISKNFGANISNKYTYSNTFNKDNNSSLDILLFNIYLNEFDNYILSKYNQKYNKEDKRSTSKEYNRNKSSIERIRKKIKKITNKNNKKELIDKLKSLKKEQKTLNSKEIFENDSYRRFEYIRYKNQFIITFSGTFDEAINIKNSICDYFNNMIDIKILKSDKFNANFLGYNILVQKCNNKLIDGARNVNGRTIAFYIPSKIIQDRINKFSDNKKIKHLTYLIDKPISEIIRIFQAEFKNISQYYKFAMNQDKLSYLKWIMEVSMMKTIARKLKTSCAKLYKKLSRKKEINGYTYKVIEYDNFYYGGVPLKRQSANGINSIIDKVKQYC